MIANVSCPRCRHSFQVDLPDQNRTYRTYCPKCRHEFDIGPPSYPAPPVPPPFAYPDEEYAKKQIMNAAYMRTRTDEIMSFAWVIIPIMLTLCSYGIMTIWFFVSMELPTFFFFFFVIIAIAVIFAVIYLILYYKLIKRRNEHFKRDMMLREGIIQFIHNRSYKTGKVYEVSADLGTLQSIHAFAQSDENEKEAILWVILSLFVPFIGLYVMYFLTKDSCLHDSRQSSFIRYASSAFQKMGITVQPSYKNIPQRSAILYLILSLFIPFFSIFLFLPSLFSVYWLYGIIKDLNNHFKSQWVFENSLVNALR